jgi:pimeloyl-ACP methyl ester carboxylesterase
MKGVSDADRTRVELSHEQAGASPTFGDKPLIVLTAWKGILGLPANDKDWAALQDIWINPLQVQLANLSTHGKRIIVPDSGHMIPLEQPYAIVNAAREVRARASSQ